MVKGKRKVLVKLIVLFSVLLLSGSLALVYLFGFDRVTLVQDASWRLLTGFPDRLEMAWNLAKKGKSFRVVDCDYSTVTDPSGLERFVKSLDSAYMILSPMVSNQIIANGIDLSSEMQAIVAGWSNADTPYLDVCLVSNETAGWEACAAELSESLLSVSSALVYDGTGKETMKAVDAINAVVGEGKLKEYEYDKGSSLWFEKVSQDMEKLQTVFVLCPYVKEINRFFENGPMEGLKWVVDYRLKGAVDKSNLSGYVEPDYREVGESVLKGQKGRHVVIEIEYRYRGV